MTDVMEDSTSTATSTTDAPVNRRFRLLPSYSDVLPRGYRAGHIFEEVPQEDRYGEWSPNLEAYAYFYTDDADREILASRPGQLTGRPHYFITRAYTEQVEPETPPGEWGEGMLQHRLRQIATRSNWSIDRVAQVTLALRSGFFNPLIEDKIASAEEAEAMAISAVRQSWPTWHGSVSRTAIRQLARDIYESTWRPETTDPITTFIPTLRGSWTTAHRARVETALRKMADDVKANGTTFEDDVDRQRALAAADANLTLDSYGAMLVPVIAFMRTVWPDAPARLTEDVVAMSEEEAKQTLVQERRRWTRSYEALHKYADDQGHCSTFDRIMESTGWPPRPKRYTIAYEVSYKKAWTPEEFERHIGGKWEAEGPVVQLTSERASASERFQETPDHEEALEKLRSGGYIDRWLAGKKLTEGDVTIKVTRVSAG